MSRNHKPRRPVERFIRRKQLAKGSSGSQSAGAGAAASGGDLGSVLSEENVEDYVAHLIANTTEISFTYNDVGNSLTADINPDSVVVGRLHITTTDKLVGRDSASSGPGEEIGLGVSLEFDGAGNIQRAALTGDVTAAANSNTTLIPNNTVTYAKMQDVTDVRLIGRSAGSSGDPQEITVGTGLSLAAGGISCNITQYTDEMVDDRVAVLIQDGTGITWTYIDGSDTLTANFDGTAAEVSYDNSSSGLAATDAQAAIDEVEDRVDTLESGGSGLTQPQVLARISMRV